MDINRPKHVVIGGGGFAGTGLYPQTGLAKRSAAYPDRQEQLSSILAITLPGGHLATGIHDVAVSLRKLFRKHPNVEVKLGASLRAKPKVPGAESTND